jgi:hypothetical protein
MVILVVIQTVVLALMLVLVVSLLKSHAAILRRLHAAGLGDDADVEHDHDHGQAPVPSTSLRGIEMDDADLRTHPDVPGLRDGSGPLVDVAGTSPKGSSVAIGIEGARHATLLAFLSSSCTTCRAFWDAFAEDPLLPGGARLVVVTQGPEHESPSAVASLAPAGATTLMSDQAWDDYTVPGSPYFVLAGPGGQLLGEGSAMAWAQVEQLIERALADASSPALGGGPKEKGARRWAERERDTDEELLSAGIRPGDPSLHHVPPTEEPTDGPD